MDAQSKDWHFSNMVAPSIPSYTLYGERGTLPDILHAERIRNRAELHNWMIAPHRHAMLHQLFLLKSGAARMSVDGIEMTLELPVVVSMPRRAVHGFAFAQGTDGHVLTLPQHAFPEAFSDGSPFAPALAQVQRLQAAPLVVHLVEEIAAVHKTRSRQRDDRLRALAMALLSTVAARSDTGAPPAAPRGHLDRFEALIAKHLRERWRIADFARVLGISTAQLTRVTRAETGLTASQLLETRRFEEARRDLAYTAMTIAEVGYSLGFDDPAYFSRAFRRQTGLSPSEYRATLDPSVIREG